MSKDYPLSSRLVLQAAARILAMDYPNELTQEERLERFNEDAAYCAAYIEETTMRNVAQRLVDEHSEALRKLADS